MGLSHPSSSENMAFLKKNIKWRCLHNHLGDNLTTLMFEYKQHNIVVDVKTIKPTILNSPSVDHVLNVTVNIAEKPAGGVMRASSLLQIDD